MRNSHSFDSKLHNRKAPKHCITTQSYIMLDSTTFHSPMTLKQMVLGMTSRL